VLERRAAERGRDRRRISDATPAIVRRQVAAWEPFTGMGGGRHLVVAADQPPERIVDAVLAWLDRPARGSALKTKEQR
jgi:hypothetical protein